MNIYTYGDDRRTFACKKHLEEGGIRTVFSRLILLPLPSTRDGVHITGTDIPLCALPLECALLVGYGLSEAVKKKCEALGGAFLDLKDDEEFIAHNAHLTALGMLGHLLTNSGRAVAECRVGIIGYGRIGKELTRYLLFLGAKVRVYTSSAKTRQSLGEYGIESVLCTYGSDERCDFGELDVLINTAPAPLVRLGDIHDALSLYELASGKNIEDGVEYTALPSLPAKMYPESSGLLYYRAVMRYLGAKGGAL